MNKKDVQKVKAAIHQFLLAAPDADRTTLEYRQAYDRLMLRIGHVGHSRGWQRQRKADKWKKAMRQFKPLKECDSGHDSGNAAAS